MVRKSQEWPNEGELIVGTVYKVVNYGAFANLEEYAGKEAFIHISEVSSGWVKNIRDHVRENQKIVARVLRVKCLDCDNEQIIFDRAASDVKCIICGKTIVKSRGGKAKIMAHIDEVLQ